VFAGVVVVGLLVAIALVGGRSAASDAAAAASPDPEAPGVSKGQTKAKTKAKAKPTSDDDEEPSVGASASASTSATAAPGPPLLSAKGHGVSVLYPKVVGDLVMGEITKVAKRALPGMSACRRTVADSVEVAVHVHPGGVITLAGPGPDNKGDAAVARCVAAAFKTSATGWKPGETGIITLQADLDAK